jgi:hypothetical protein
LKLDTVALTPEGLLHYKMSKIGKSDGCIFENFDILCAENKKPIIWELNHMCKREQLPTEEKNCHLNEFSNWPNTRKTFVENTRDSLKQKNNDKELLFYKDKYSKDPS